MFIAWGIATVVKNEKNKKAAAQHTCPECGEKKKVDAVVLKRESPKAAKEGWREQGWNWTMVGWGVDLRGVRLDGLNQWGSICSFYACMGNGVSQVASVPV
ncbi:hypothetical protein B0A54_08869 [Friedmanniomyces endolithicus]|uniref:LITAF domain-containing protein n=1 Tax=Friedmanniomyces endolithicus TaxID=329885 RepID=A0A4U0UVD9_9PEZI|nr:hypothetical protein B0A54_08869 [Friedmanniomyces endolithicus]